MPPPPPPLQFPRHLLEWMVGVGGSDPSKVAELATSHDHVTILFTGKASNYIYIFI